MLSKLSFIDVMAAVQTLVEKNTQKRCYDFIPKDQDPPFYSVEIPNQEPHPNKTMWVERYDIFLHCWAPAGESSAPVLLMIKALEEAMTEAIRLPEPYNLLMQTPHGGRGTFIGEDGTYHAVMQYRVMISYGFKSKI